MCFGQRKPALSLHFAETKRILIIRRLVGSSDGSIYNLHLRAQVCFAIIRGMQNKHHHIMYDVAMSHLSTRGVSWYLPMHVYKLTYLPYHLVDSNRELLPSIHSHSFDIEIKTQLVFGGRSPTLCFFSVPHLNSQRRPPCVCECAAFLSG